ncbi:MAG: hypothetical protein ABIV10_00925 [Gemmatimonadaceae bacterium]
MRAQVSEIQPGARVRITAPGIVAGRYAATVLSRTADTVRVSAPDKVPFDIPVRRITSLEVSRGNSRTLGAVRGVLWGLGIGLAVGTIVAVTDDGSVTYGTRNTGEILGFSVLSGSFYGAIIGAIVGRERWERFDMPVRTTLRVQPGQVGAAFGFTY